MLLLVDLDGVVYRGTQPVAGVAEVLRRRAAAGDDIVYITNSSIWHRDDFVARLASIGAPFSPERVISGARATALYLAGVSPRPSRVLVVGSAGLAREVGDAGLDVVTAAQAGERWSARDEDARAAIEGVDAVVAGLDTSISWPRLVVASAAVRSGARFVAVNRDPVHPTEHGIVPGAGAIVAAIATGGGSEPVTIGKPGPHLLEIASRLVGLPAADAIVIGDSLTSDIAAAHAVHARSVLMLTGVTTRAHLAAQTTEGMPTAVAADALELRAVLELMAGEALPQATDAGSADV